MIDGKYFELCVKHLCCSSLHIHTASHIYKRTHTRIRACSVLANKEIFDFQLVFLLRTSTISVMPIHCCGIFFCLLPVFFSVWLVQLTILWFVCFVEISVNVRFAYLLFSYVFLMCRRNWMCYHLIIIDAETRMIMSVDPHWRITSMFDHKIQCSSCFVHMLFNK